MPLMSSQEGWVFTRIIQAEQIDGRCHQPHRRSTVGDTTA
jgi:hypothetical protein